MLQRQQPIFTDSSNGFGSPAAAVGGGHPVPGARRRQPAWTAAIAFAVLVSGWAQVARAQEATSLVGRVRDVRTGLPLPNVSVTLLDTETGARTNFWGEYRLDCGSATEVNVRLVLLGYATVVERVAVTGERTIADFELTPVGAVLDELIVRDRSPRAVDGEAGLAAGTVDLEGVRGSSTDDALKGIPGVLILRPSGVVGSGTKIQLRGLRSLLSGNEPLVYVDGVRTSYSTSPLFGVRGESLLDLIPPSQIDHIEVFKGPAATARYGIGALSGVIHIHTKKGSDRKPR